MSSYAASPVIPLDQVGPNLEMIVDGMTHLRGRVFLFNNATFGGAVVRLLIKIHPDDEWVEQNTSDRLSTSTAHTAPIDIRCVYAVRLETLTASSTSGALARLFLCAQNTP